MRPLTDIFFIRANPDIETTYVMENGKEIYLAPPTMGEANKLNFSPFERAVQIGQVVISPHKISKGFIYDTPINAGDLVSLHHFVVSEDNVEVIEGEKLYRARYFQIFSIIKDNAHTPCHNYLFCEPVYESEDTCKTKSGIWIKDKPDQMKQTAKVLYACKSAEAYGVYPGDTIKFDKDADYRVTIGKTDYWRIPLDRVPAKVVAL